MKNDKENLKKDELLVVTMAAEEEMMIEALAHLGEIPLHMKIGDGEALLHIKIEDADHLFLQKEDIEEVWTEKEGGTEREVPVIGMAMIEEIDIM